MRDGVIVRVDTANQTCEIEYVEYTKKEEEDDDDDDDDKAGRAKIKVSVPLDHVDSIPFSVLNYFFQRRSMLQSWYEVCKIVVLVQPSSCAAERVFSLLEQKFSKRGNRGRAKQDLIDATAKITFHDRPL